MFAIDSVALTTNMRWQLDAYVCPTAHTHTHTPCTATWLASLTPGETTTATTTRGITTVALSVTQFSSRAGQLLLLFLLLQLLLLLLCNAVI